MAVDDFYLWGMRPDGVRELPLGNARLGALFVIIYAPWRLVCELQSSLNSPFFMFCAV